jgi:hypothetical protein
MTRSLGQLNAYVEAGKTKEEQLKRLDEVPDKHRKDVIKHMRTVIAIKNKSEGK